MLCFPDQNRTKTRLYGFRNPQFLKKHAGHSLLPDRVDRFQSFLHSPLPGTTGQSSHLSGAAVGSTSVAVDAGAGVSKGVGREEDAATVLVGAIVTGSGILATGIATVGVTAISLGVQSG